MFQKFCCGIRFCRLMHIIGYAEFNSLTNFVLYLNQFIIKKIGLLFSIVCHKNSHYIFCFLLVVNILHKYRYFLTTQYDARVPLEVTAHYAELSICLYWVILNYASFLLHAVISKFFSTAVSASCHQKFTEDLTVCSVCAECMFLVIVHCSTFLWCTCLHWWIFSVLRVPQLSIIIIIIIIIINEIYKARNSQVQ